MKEGPQATAQYAELAAALSGIGAAWVVEEVRDVVSRGKTVPFRELAPDERSPYEERLDAETQKGLQVGKAKSADQVGVPYEASEELGLLVDAAERVIASSARCHTFIVDFAAQHELNFVNLEESPTDTPAGQSTRQEVPLTRAADMPARLQALHDLLRNQVAE